MKIYAVNLAVVCIFIVSIHQSQGLSRFGGVCTGPDGTIDGCDHSTTFLYCYEGKCKCPDSFVMTSANLPINLHAKWNQDANKCLAIRDSSCGVQPGGNKMECQNGMKCNLRDNSKIGTCGSSYLHVSIFGILSVSLMVLLKSL